MLQVKSEQVYTRETLEEHKEESEIMGEPAAAEKIETSGWIK